MTLTYSIDDHVTVSDPTVNSEVDIGLAESARYHGMAEQETFDRPVDVAFTLETDRLWFDRDAKLLVRDAETNEIVVEFNQDNDGAVDAGAYVCELVGLPVKLYIDVAAPNAFSVLARPLDGRLVMEFPAATTVTFGLRSLYQQAEGVITTPPDLDHIFDAVSVVCGAIEEDGPERSFSTLRDHPPKVAIGDEYRVDTEISRPDTGIVLRTPKSLHTLYSVAPLAYYLKADLKPVDESVPVLEADGRTVALGSAREDVDVAVEAATVSDAASRVLQHVFLLDCLVRHAGWGYDTGEAAETEAVRTVLEDHGVSFDTDDLYALPLAARTARYLEFPIGVANDVFEWPTVADVTPDPSNVTDVPGLLNDLAQIRSPPQPRTMDDQPTDGLVDAFYASGDRPDRGVMLRGGVDAAGGDTATGTDVESPVSPSEPTVDTASTDVVGETVSPASGAHQQHVAVEPDYPIWSAKPTGSATSTPSVRSRTDSGTTVDAYVVSNADGAGDLDAFYAETPIDVDEVTVEADVTAARLRSIIEDGCAFLHVSSHVEEDGIQCRDGVLDVDELDESNVELFILNGCSSYRQGEALIEKGSFAGVVSTDDVLSREAFRFGVNCLGLLGRGFSVGAALSVLREELNGPPRYLVLGDWAATIRAQGTESTLAVVDGTGDRDGELQYRVVGYGGWQWGIGSIYESQLLKRMNVDHPGYWLGPGRAGPFTCTPREFREAWTGENGVVVDSTLYTGAGDDPAPVGAGEAPESLIEALRDAAQK
jgi:hypothetical protein